MLGNERVWYTIALSHTVWNETFAVVSLKWSSISGIFLYCCCTFLHSLKKKIDIWIQKWCSTSTALRPHLWFMLMLLQDQNSSAGDQGITVVCQETNGEERKLFHKLKTLDTITLERQRLLLQELKFLWFQSQWNSTNLKLRAGRGKMVSLVNQSSFGDKSPNSADLKQLAAHSWNFCQCTVNIHCVICTLLKSWNFQLFLLAHPWIKTAIFINWYIFCFIWTQSD